MALTSVGNATLGALTATAGDITAKAGAALIAGTLTSSSASIDLESVAGSVTVNSATARTAFNALSKEALTLRTFNAATATLDAGTDLLISGGVTSGAMALTSVGNATLGALTATAGNITAKADGTLVANSLRADGLDLSGKTGLTAGTLTSTTAGIDLASSAGSVTVNRATAKTAFNALSRDSLNIRAFNAATATLDAGTDLLISGGVTSGAMVLSSAGDTTLGTLTATAGNIKADAGGTLVANSLRADGLDLSGDARLTAGTLTSTSTSIDLESVAGSVTVNSATAKTAFNAHSGESLFVRSFTVTTGNAVLQSGGSTLISAGQTTGNIEVTSAGDTTLGNLTSSAGQLNANAARGGLTFGTLRAGTGISLTADKAVSGSTLYVNRGRVDVRAKLGNINIGTLSVATPVGVSQLTTEAGAIRVSKISGLSPSQLNVSATGGSKSLPSGY